MGGSIYGLVSGHAYTFLDIQELKDSTGSVKHTIAKLRNPWAVEMYKGPWSDTDPNWTDEWKKQVNLAEANDGAFWMPFDVYFKKFDNLAVALYQPYKYHLKQLYASERQYRLEINNPVKQYLYITAETYSYRHYPRGSKCDPNNNIVLFFKNNNNQSVDKQRYEWVSHEGFGTMGRWAEELPAGIYTFTVVNQGHATKAADLSLHFYATKQVPKATTL